MTSINKVGGYMPVNQIKTKNSDLSRVNSNVRIFVAGGSEVDRKIEAANRQVTNAYEIADKLMAAFNIAPKETRKSQQGLLSSIKRFILR